MMYSNVDLKNAIELGDLVVNPFHPEHLKAGGIGMHLGPKLLKPRPGTVIDVKTKTLPEYEEIIITEDKPYVIQPQEFLLGHTYEKVTVGNKLGFFIEGRSTLARIGLTVVQTAMLVYPGHRDRVITLELANHGPNPIKLYPKMKIARSAIFELKTTTNIEYDLKGKYRNQDTVGVAIFDQEISELDYPS